MFVPIDSLFGFQNGACYEVTMTTDAELLRAYAEKKSEAAFGELVRRQVNLVYAVALRQCGGDASLAQDVTQRVFTDLARKARQLSGHAMLGGWLHRSAWFAASDVVRAERRRRAREEEAQAMQDISKPGVADADWKNLAPLLDEAVGELPERDRDAVVARFFEGKTFGEIGATLRLSEDAARMRVERALEKLPRQPVSP
jgi:RNA polymerase sigma factor (sigma-70 family)